MNMPMVYAFLKPDPNGIEEPGIQFGVRPISVCCCWRRCAFKPTATQFARENASTFAAHGQFAGGGVKSGIEAVPRMLQILHEAVKRNCTLSEDCMNAFHELDRDKIEACLEEKSPVLRAAKVGRRASDSSAPSRSSQSS